MSCVCELLSPANPNPSCDLPQSLLVFYKKDLSFGTPSAALCVPSENLITEIQVYNKFTKFEPLI
jgi:hypothetical protein